jgi:hypothetical protein
MGWKTFTMAKQSPHKTWKGCRLCSPHKNRANGQAARKPLAELRKLGKLRRVSRHELGD